MPTAPFTFSASSAHDPPFFNDVHSHLQNLMGTLSNMRNSLDYNEATNQQLCEDVRRSINIERTETREAINTFRYGFDELLHTRVESVADSLEQMEQRQKFKDRHQQSQIDSLQSQMQSVVGNMGGINQKWQNFKRNSEDLGLKRQQHRRQEEQKELDDAEAAAVASGAWSPRCTTLRPLLADEAERLHRSSQDNSQVYIAAEKARARLKGAAETLHGSEWEGVLRQHDADGSGQINFEEFIVLCSVRLKLQESDRVLQALFDSLDTDGSGEVSISELVEFVADPAERMRNRIQRAIDEVGGAVTKFVLDHDRYRGSTLCFSDFRTLCREKLKVLDADHHLKAVFKSIDTDGSGAITPKELVAWIDGGRGRGSLTRASLTKRSSRFAR